MKQLISYLIVLTLSLATCIIQPAPAHSGTLNGIHIITASDLNAPTGNITFNELPDETLEPVYTPAEYGGDATAPTLTFKAMFEGQRYSRNTATDCPGATALGCIISNPSNPLSLSTDIRTRIVGIISNPAFSDGRVIATQKNAAYSILFDKDVARVGITVGDLDAVGAVKVKVFDRTGALLGEVTNSTTGTEYLGFATDDDKEKIAGVQLSLVGAENDGYLIGDISFIQQVPHNVVCNDLVVNGSFEKPVVLYYGLEPSIEGWDLVQGKGIEINNQYISKPYDGSQFVDLDSTNSTTKISQKIATQVGETYKLTFAFEATNHQGDRDKLNVNWGNELVVALDKGASDDKWEVKTYNLEAKSTETILSFDNLNEIANSYGTRLDAVSLNLCQ
ncbi:MAG: DUF642 domain-containing protein [Microcoleaceae cyanobacterium]